MRVYEISTASIARIWPPTTVRCLEVCIMHATLELLLKVFRGYGGFVRVSNCGQPYLQGNKLSAAVPKTLTRLGNLLADGIPSSMFAPVVNTTALGYWFRRPKRGADLTLSDVFLAAADSMVERDPVECAALLASVSRCAHQARARAPNAVVADCFRVIATFWDHVADTGNCANGGAHEGVDEGAVEGARVDEGEGAHVDEVEGAHVDEGEGAHVDEGEGAHVGEVEGAHVGADVDEVDGTGGTGGGSSSRSGFGPHYWPRDRVLTFSAIDKDTKLFVTERILAQGSLLFAHEQVNQRMASGCGMCGRVPDNDPAVFTPFLVCGGACGTAYCSEACQRAHWKMPGGHANNDCREHWRKRLQNRRRKQQRKLEKAAAFASATGAAFASATGAAAFAAAAGTAAADDDLD